MKIALQTIVRNYHLCKPFSYSGECRAIALRGGCMGGGTPPLPSGRRPHRGRGWRLRRQQLAIRNKSAGTGQVTTSYCYKQRGMQRGRRDAPLAKCHGNPLCGVNVNHLRATYFFEPTRETKRSASYTSLPAVFRAAGASVGLSCGMGWAVVLWAASRILGGGRGVPGRTRRR